MLNSKALDSDTVICIKRRQKELWIDRSNGERLHGLTCGGAFRKDIHANFGTTDRIYQRVTVGTHHSATLPDYVLLKIFNFYVDNAYDEDDWHTLAHVCQTWRNVVFASPRRLRLRLLCTQGRAAKNMLDVWPALPILVKEHYFNLQLQGVNNVIDALTYNDLIYKINIQAVPSLLLEGIATVKEPFTVLTSLALQSNDESPPALPDSFFGGFVPRLQELNFDGIPSPVVGKLLLSANDLVSLRLWNIPNSGYIAPEEMVTSLSTLIKLKSLFLGFRSPLPRTDRDLESQHPPLPARVVLPALTSFHFKGDSEYLEDIIVRISAPLLDTITIRFFHQLIFDTPRLRDFIRHTEKFNAPHRLDVDFSRLRCRVTLYRKSGLAFHKALELGVSCAASDWQLSCLIDVCGCSLPPLPSLERLDIREGGVSQPRWRYAVDGEQWVELLRPFDTVKTLEISETFVGRVAPALKILGRRERATEVLPVLQDIFLEGPEPPGPVLEAIGQFVAVRRLSGQPVAIHHRESRRWWHMRGEIY